jgi:carbon starvation protein CstA
MDAIAVFLMIYLFYYFYSAFIGILYLFTNKGYFQTFTKIGAIPSIAIELIVVCYTVYQNHYDDVTNGILLFIISDLIGNVCIHELMKTEQVQEGKLQFDV